MRLQVKSPQEFWAGVMFLGLATIFLISGADLRGGTSSQMGSGYFPRLVASLLGVVGICQILIGLRQTSSPLEKGGRFRDIAVPVGAFILFGITISRFGFIGSSALTVFLGFFSAPESPCFERIAVTAAVVAASVLVFSVGLGLPVDLWPSF
ncbi:tripartite tricarboxylate transporter TctB family protein [Rhizobium leguminosarum]|uniref:tripartite tricarboxylate transporter TctB family protein n=1 Tax=Rhizobium leguminosarum TaxID=384 RepID=UPI003F94384B